jgi:catechol 2,3-dioxygenase-like lactoylglutathione lyase family enzyme
MSLTLNELVVYIPARDFEVSVRFYTALGFELTDGWGETMDCRLGGSVFRLQNYYVKDWAENFMMKFDVDDVGKWYEHVRQVLDENTYGDARVAEPE